MEHQLTKIMQDFKRLLLNLAASGQESVYQVEMLSKSELQYLTADLDKQKSPAEPDKLLYQLVQDRANEQPEHVAVVFAEQVLTYLELEQAANRLANFLQTQGVTNQTLVGICLARSVEMVVAMLAVHKAGGAFVPLEPSHPKERLDYVLEETGLKHLICDEAAASYLKPGDEIITLVIDSDEHQDSIQDSSY